MAGMLLVVFSLSCQKNEPIPVARFSFSGNNQFKIPCTITFTNTSTDSYSYLWKFGDDSVSGLRNPIHTYTKPGKYNVYLQAYTESQREWASVIKTFTIKDTAK